MSGLVSSQAPRSLTSALLLIGDRFFLTQQTIADEFHLCRDRRRCPVRGDFVALKASNFVNRSPFSQSGRNSGRSEFMFNWLHATHAAAHEKQHPKLAGVMLIIIGLFLTPWLIGLPIMGYGIYKLSE
jgi:hypothetical protein